MSNALASQDKVKYGIGGDTIVPLGIQPKLGYRFIVKLEDFSDEKIDINSRTLTGHVVSITPPEFSQEEVPIDVYTSRYYVVGKHSIGDISLTLRNDIDGEVAEAVQRQIDKQYDSLTQSHAATASDIKFTVKIMYLDGTNSRKGQLDSDGNVIPSDHPTIKEVFICTGCWLKNVSWGELQYTSNEPVQITLSIRPDNFYHIVNRGSNVAVDDGYKKSTVYTKPT